MKNKNLSIIFDLDGTLWNSTGCASDIWNRVLEKHNDISFRMTKEKAAHFAGIPFIYAKYGFGKVKSSDAVITDIRELPECIKTFDNSDLCIYKNIIG